MLGQKTLDQMLTFARTSTKYVMGPGKLFVPVAIGIPALEFDANLGTPRGASIETQAVNQCWPSMPRRPVGDDDAYMTVSNRPSIIQGQTAARYVSKGNGNPNYPPANGFSWTTAVRMCCWMIVETDPTSSAPAVSTTLSIYRTSGTPAIITTVNLAHASGAIVTSGSATRTGGGRKIMDVGPNGGAVYLIYITDTNTAGDTYNCYPYIVASNTAGHSAIVHHVQCEAGDLPTSPIVTSTAQVTRVGDTFVQSDLTRMAFNPQEGTCILDFVVPDTPSSTRSYMEFGDGTLNNRFYLGVDAGRAATTTAVLGGAAGSGVASELLQPAVGQRVKVAMAYGKGQLSICQTGRLVINTPMAVVPPVNRFALGSTNNLVNQAKGIFFGFQYIPERKADAQIQALVNA